MTGWAAMEGLESLGDVFSALPGCCPTVLTVPQMKYTFLYVETRGCDKLAGGL